ncbi:AAA family ATPase [Candidatus Micrarchaeota archaeon]|nr:AAA family ATPase [Candidatus Micrarchaeota archaeon]
MPNVFASVQERQGIFRREEALSPDFLPETLPGREAQEREIASLLSPAASGKRSRNIFISGPPGTGKTATCRHVLAQLQEYSSKPACVFVNCWHHDTRQSVLSEIAQKLGQAIPRRGVAADEVYDRVLGQLKRDRQVCVVFLDEADKLSNGEEKVLYDLGRAGEAHGVFIAIVMVSNDEGLLARTDARIRSSLSPACIEFKAYKPTELKAILAKRTEAAFAPGACPPESIALCAAHASMLGGDARIAISALYAAGKSAEAKGHRIVEEDDAREAIGKSMTSAQEKLERDREELITGEKKVLAALEQAGGETTSGDLYALLSGMSPRSVRNYLAGLEGRKIIETQMVQKEGQMVRIVRLRE